MMKNFGSVLLILLVSCSGTPERPRPSEWQGSWNAKWETLPASYPGVEGMSFTMNGSFIFSDDSLTVRADGYEGCIFSPDTIKHTQTWYVKNDTLFLQNDPEFQGMTYRIKGKTENQIELQLLDDIFVTLTK